MGEPGLLATGGYGRRELFPASDLDLLFVVPAVGEEKQHKDRIRSFTQALWDEGVRVAATTPTCMTFRSESVQVTCPQCSMQHDLPWG